MEQRFNRKRFKKIIRVASIVFICYFLAIFITSFIYTPILVTGHSMAPTLNGNEYGYTNQLFYKFFGIKRFSIIVVEDQEYGKLIKRVIAKPGERFSYQNGTLYIDGKIVIEKFLGSEKYLTGDIEEIVIPKNKYYIMGDNRGNSIDSRLIGLIDKSQIFSVGITIIATCDRIEGTSCKGRKYKWPSIK